MGVHSVQRIGRMVDPWYTMRTSQQSLAVDARGHMCPAEPTHHDTPRLRASAYGSAQRSMALSYESWRSMAPNIPTGRFRSRMLSRCFRAWT